MFYLCVFFPPLLLSLLLLFAPSDKRRQPAKQGCSGTNLSITADGTLTTCTLKIKLVLKAGAWQPSLWKWLQCSATEKAEREKNILRKQQCDGSREREWKKEKQKLKAKRIRTTVLMVGIGVISLPFLIWWSSLRTCRHFQGCCCKSLLILEAFQTLGFCLHTQSWPRPVSVFQMIWKHGSS